VGVRGTADVPLLRCFIDADFVLFLFIFVAHRLFLDGAAFDFNNDVLVDPKPKELFSQGPSIWIKPVKSAVLQVREQR